MQRFSWIGVGALALLLAGAVPALPQDGSDDSMLEQVIVTAQKKEQDLEEVPSSVAALRGEKLEVMTSGGGDIRLLSSRVPSLHVESSFGRTFPRFYIRGLGNTDFDLNASQPVSLVYDGVVLENPILKGFPIFDVDRVEVLRGPQGTLFGRNTPAGIVKFESRQPTWDVDGFGRLSYGRYHERQFEGALGGPLVDGALAGRVSLLYQGRSDWVDNKFRQVRNELGGHDEVAARAQLLYTPTPEFRALVNVHGRELNGTARLFHANMVNTGSNDIVSENFKRDEVQHDGRNEQELQTGGGVLTLDWDLERVTLTSVSGYETGNLYSRGDIDGGFGAVFASPSGPGVIPFPSETADAVPGLDQFTQELRVASNRWERFNFQAGGFYFWEDLKIKSYNYDTLNGGVENGFAKQHQEAKAYAAFGTVEVSATDRLVLSGGARFSHDEKDFVAERPVSPPGFPTPPPLPPIRANPQDDMVGWDVSALVRVTDRTNVYGRVARGFRAPSIQGRVLFGDTLSVADTEKILSYEAGVKGTFLDGRARGGLSGFYYQMKDQQLTAVGGATNFNRLLNADKTNGAGFEAELDALLTDSMVLTAGASYNRTRIDDPNLRTQIPGPDPGNPFVTIRDPVDPNDNTLVNINDNRLPNAPEWVLNATLRDSYPVGRDGELFFYTDWAYRSEVSFFLYDSVEFTEGGMVEGGLRAGWSRPDRSLEIAAFGRNITNTEARTGGIDFNNLTGFVNEPAMWGLEIRSQL